MGDVNPVLQALGRIEGKMDQVIDAAKEHRDDDKRRFAEVYAKLGEHDKEIAAAKGAKSALIWLVSGGAAAIGGLVVMAGKAFGIK